MSKGLSAFLVALTVTVIGGIVAGIVTLVVQYGVFEQASRTGSQQQPDLGKSAPAEKAESPAPEATNASSAPVVATPIVPVSPVPLDDKIITQARVVVVGDKIAPNVYRESSPPGYYADVFTAAGEVSYRDGCYVHWELYDNGVLTTTDDSKCGLAGGWSTTWWPNDTNLAAGDLRVTASITNDWGSTANVEADFAVR